METQTETEKEKAAENGAETQEQPQPEPQELVKAKFKFYGTQDFKKILAALQELIGDEVTFQITMQGVRVVQMEPSRVAMTVLTMEKGVFDEFLCIEEGFFAFDLERLIGRTFKNVYKDETVEFVFSNGKAHVTMEASFVRNFDVTLLQPQEEQPPLPKNVRHTAQVKLVTKHVRNILKDVEENINLIATSEGIKFEERTEDLDNFFVDLKRGSDGLLDLELSQPTKSTYSETYIKSFIEAVKDLSELFTLSFANDMPMKLSCDLLSRIPLVFWLAPRIYSDKE